MSVQITVIYDNRSHNPCLQEGWGFSALVEYQGKKILFDAGGDHLAFSSNINKLQVPYAEITHLLFSHRHWDHITGLKEIVEKVQESTILYVPKTFPRRLIKLASSRIETKVIRSFEEIEPNIYSLVLRGGFLLYEQALVLKTPTGLGIITGCAHPGVIQMVKSAQQYLPGDISFVLGGFHLHSASREHCTDVVKRMQGLCVQKIAPCHCSGDDLISQFQEAFGTNFCQVGTGSKLTF